MMLISSSSSQALLLQVISCVTLKTFIIFGIAGLDYGHVGMSSPLTSSVTIPSGELSVSFSINIIDDTVQEENETFSLTVDLQSGLLLVTNNGNHSFIITIIDDEGNDTLVCCMYC